MSAADQAELDVIVWELITCVRHHNARCQRCRNHVDCPPVAEAVQAVSDWVYGRNLHERLVVTMLRDRLERDL